MRLPIRDVVTSPIVILFIALVLNLSFMSEAKADCLDPFGVVEPVDVNEQAETVTGFQGLGGIKRAGDYNTQDCNQPPPPPTPGKPSTPTVSVTQSTSGSYTVSWSASSNMVSGGSQAFGYELLEYKNGSYVKKYSTSPSTRSRSISNNPNGNYQYKVRGCNLDIYMGVPVCGSYSSLSSTNYVRYKPSTPSKPNIASSTSTGTVSVSWSKPSGAVTFYSLQKRKGSGSWSTVTSNTSSTSYSVTGLTDGSWDFRVRACNGYSWACSSYSSDSANTTVRLKPATPSAPSVPSSDVDGSYTISWNKPSGTVTVYDVLEYKNSTSSYTVVANDTSARSLNLAGRGDGNYTYRVRACNQYSWACSSYSAHSGTTKVLHKPGTPASITGPTSLDNDGTFTVSWGEASGQVGYYQTAHRHKVLGGSFGSWIYVNRGTARAYGYSGLADGEWDFAIRACNASGCSTWRYISPHVTVLRKPGAPSSITVPTSTDTDGMHDVSWAASSGNSITAYKLEERLKPYGNSSYGAWSEVQSSTARSRSYSNRTDGDWQYRVRGCNAAGCSAYASSSTVTVLKIPYAPVNASVPATDGDGTFDISWSAPSSVISRYEYAESPSFSPWHSVGAALSKRISGKSDGSWSYRVRACNASGCGIYTTTNTVAVSHPIPPTPSSITVPAQVAQDNYSISWNPVSSSVLDAYQISQQHESNGWSGWQAVSAPASGTQVSVNAAGDWRHKVRACNKLPDNSYKCSAEKVSSVVDVQLPPQWARVGGATPDAAWSGDTGILHGDANVGALEGSGGVSGGAATYSIPIVIPPGRAGMQPSVSLNYSSRSGSGIAGVGWSLSAGSSIHRCAATAAQDGQGKAVTYDADDKLCLDGQRLIAVSGIYGQSGTTYHTELDRFAKIEQVGSINDSSAYFTVSSKDNRTSKYGSTSDSKHKAGGKTQILSWAITEVLDSSGNTMTYDYYNYTNGENLLKAIHYTGTNGSDGDRHVNFVYENRPDISRSYLAGGLTVSTKRLKTVETKYQSQRIREYKLGYDVSDFSERSIVNSVQECASGTCLPATQIATYQPNYSWANTDSSASANRVLPSLGRAVEEGDRLEHIDLDGDGVLELIYMDLNVLSTDDDPTKIEIHKRNINGDFEKTPYEGRAPVSKGDINLDGIVDFLYVDSDTNKLGYTQFNGDMEEISYLTNTTAQPGVKYGSKQLDVNGDGYPDLVFRDYSDNSVKYYRRSTNGNIEFTGPYTLTTMRQRYIPGNSYIREEPSYIDMDGDGYIDVLKTYLKSSSSLEVNITFGRVVNGQWSADTNKSSSQLGLPSNHFLNQHFFADLNGDGLKDFVRPVKISTDNYDWRVRINTGNRTFATEKSLGTQVGIHEHQVRTETSLQTKIQSKWGGATFADFDNDGKEELITPTYSDDNLCTKFIGIPVEHTTGEPYEVDVCNDDMHNQDRVTLTNNSNLGIYIDFGKYDFRRFNWSVVDFKNTTNGLTFESTTPNVVTAPVSHFKGLNMDHQWEPLGLKDLDNDGLLDFNYRITKSYTFDHCNPPPSGITPYNCRYNMVGGSYYNVVLNVYFDTGTPPIHEGYYEQLNLIGKNAADGKLADTAESIENGLGVTTAWDYAPLSKHLSRAASDKGFYFVPKDPENRYTSGDPEHFMFTSSMYVVSDSYHSNGLGDDTNHKQYSYREAVYNRMGRGFQGFRSIMVDDLASGQRAVTDFKQFYPFAGKVESARSCLIADGDDTCSNPISRSSFDYHDMATTSGGKTRWVYPTQSVKRSYDLANRNLLLSQETTHVGTSLGSDIDAYGNILRSIKETDNGFQTVRLTQTQGVTVDAANWWLNKVNWSKTESQTLSRDTAVGAPIAAGTDPVKWTRSDFSYNGQGLAHRIPTQTVTTASDSNLSHTVTIDNLNSHGLPTSVTSSGQGQGTGSQLTRQVRTSYSSDGYFPQTVTQENGGYDLVTTTQVSPLHGQVLSTTDANGVTTSMSYDAFGRLKSQTVPGGQPIEFGYQWYSGGLASHAKYRTFTKQAGSPTVLSYKDVLNRTLLTQTHGFGGAWIYQRTAYDAQGRQTLATQPSFDAYSEVGTRYTAFDALGRVLSKEVDQSDYGVMSSSYSYSGHQTDIRVLDSGELLSMSRTYGGDGQLIRTTDGLGGVTRYAYDSAGNPIALRDAKGHSITAGYNGFGHKTQVDDPNLGIKSFAYNTFGEVEREQDANGSVLTMTYDAQGRMTQRRVDGVVQGSWTYDSHYKGRGQLATQSAAGLVQSFGYDGYARPWRQVTTIDGQPYETVTEYDATYGRVKAVHYPSDIKVATHYDAYGYQTKLSNAASGFVYQEVTQRDARLNLTEAKANAGSLTETRSYWDASGQLHSIQVATSQGAQEKHRLLYDYGAFGNLGWQQQWFNGGSQSSREDYQYDSLHRLTQSRRSINGAAQTAVTYGYDAVGNLTHKSDYATAYQYASGKPNAVSQVTKLNGSTVNYAYDNNGNLTSGDGKILTYNAFNKPLTVSKNGITSSFSYGADLMRYKQTKGSETTLYLDKLVEIVTKGNKTTTKTYIGDVAIVTKEETAGNPLPNHTIAFTHRDRLGSVITLTDHNNQILEHRSYDPFGKPRNGDFSNTSPATLGEVALYGFNTHGFLNDKPLTHRGFTDHEHLDDAELIHMNGRVYDYNLGRFLSVDPFIQAPGNSQSMNPYSYIMNNPLAGTDPSGYKSICKGRSEMSCKTIEINGDLGGESFGFTKTLDNGKQVNFTVTLKTGAEVEKIEDINSDTIDSVSFEVEGEGFIKVYSGGTDVVVGAYGSANVPTLPCETGCHGFIPPPPDMPNMLNVLQGAISAAGMIPGLGEAFDLLNAGISTARGNLGDAALHLASAVPVAGTYTAVAAISMRGAQVVKSYGVNKRPFALGIREHLNLFAKRHNADTWKNLNDPVNWRPEVLNKILDPNQKVLFNLQGVNVWSGVQRASMGGKGATDWELLQVKNNPQIWDSIEFWQGQKKVGNPFE